MRTTPNVVTIIQARTGSTRLPGKVLLPLLGEPVLMRMLERLQSSKLAGTIVVATTTGVEDDAIEQLCLDADYPCFRGHPTDLLDRHYRAAAWLDAEAVVKIPSDCPLIDPRIVDQVIGAYLTRPGEFDFVSNLHPATYPDGNDVEIMRFDALAAAWQEASRPWEREHTTPFLWERPEHFRLGNLAWETGLDYSMTHRWTLDYPEDYEFIRAVFESLYPRRPQFGLHDILAVLAARPQLHEINRRHAGVNWYRHHLAELRTIAPIQTRVEGWPNATTAWAWPQDRPEQR